MKTITLQSIELSHFKKHTHLVVDFSPTLTAIRGPNYAGKSSILDAIFFAQFGVSAVAGTRETIVEQGHTNCKVILTLLVDGKTVFVVRTLTTAALHVENDLVASGHSAVSSWMADAYGMSSDILLNLAYSSEEETSALLTLGPSKLNQMIEEVSDVDYIDRMVNAAGKVAALAEAKLAALPAVRSLLDVGGELTDTEDRLKELVVDLAELEDQHKELKGKMDSISEKLSDASRYNAKAQAQNEKRRSLIQAVEQARTQWDQVIIGERPVDPNQLAAVVEATQRDLTNAKVSQNKRRELQREAKELAGKLQQALSWKETEREVNKALDFLIPTVDRVLRAANDAKANLEKSKEKLKEAKAGVCSSCQRPFNPSHTHSLNMAELQDAVRIAARVEEETYRQLSEVNREADALRAKLPPNGWCLLKDSWDKRMEELRTQVLAIPKLTDQDLYDLDHTWSLASGNYSNALGEWQRYKLQLERKRSCEKELDRLASIPLPEAVELVSVEELVVELRQLQAVNQELMTDISRTRESHGAVSRMYGQLVDEQSVILKVAGDRAAFEKRSSRFSSFQKWLSKNKAAFMEEIWSKLSLLMSEFVSQVTSGRVDRIWRETDGAFWFSEDGRGKPVKGCASGGQKAIMGAALRLALASLLPQGCRYIVLDEPSAKLNDEHAAALAGALRAQDRQVVLVTHREGDEFAADSVVLLG